MSGTRRESVFVCELCGDRFGRLEHLNRHVLSHTDTRPFSCTLCNRSFARRDTLNRHEAIHTAESSGGRSNQACRTCARLKARCDGSQPCARCESRARHCTYPPKISRRRIMRVVPTGPETMLPPTTSSPEISSALPHMPSRHTDHSQQSIASQFQSETPFNLAEDLNYTFAESTNFANFNMFDWIDWTDENPLEAVSVAEFAQSTSISASEPGEDLHNTCGAIDDEFSNNSSIETPLTNPLAWEPTATDNWVVFPKLDTIKTDFVDIEDIGHVGAITTGQYTNIQQCLNDHERKGLRYYYPLRNAHLPSISVMNCFVQLYFEHFQPIFPMLHPPTFSMADTPWQLVLAFASIGCRYSKAIERNSKREWADAFQEFLRRALSETASVLISSPFQLTYSH